MSIQVNRRSFMARGAACILGLFGLGRLAEANITAGRSKMIGSKIIVLSSFGAEKWLSSQRLEVDEVARWYCVPPELIDPKGYFSRLHGS